MCYAVVADLPLNCKLLEYQYDLFAVDHEKYKIEVHIEWLQLSM